MSYTVLARKYRPQTFADLVGQEHVTRTLANAITSGRVAHAFLFTGVRGVGKTTSARILAKALNCEQGPTPEPCNACSACQQITQGTDLDVIEMDGASNNSVEDVRRLQESIPFRPARARFKIVIVDEVHMLSTGAFNAFLKTLEEPPPHVKFIFATTEAHKLPVTIRSRCQRYDFRLIPQAVIAEHVTRILAKEQIEADEAAVAIVAREAQGSMRDALTLLDQVVAFSGEKLLGREVSERLGIADREHVYTLSAAVLGADARAVLDVVDAVATQGIDVLHFTRQWLELTRDMVVLRVADDGGLVELTPDEQTRAKELAQRVELVELQRVFAAVAKLVDEVGKAAQPRTALEMGALRLATRPKLREVSELIARIERLERSLAEGGGPRPPSGGGRPGPSGAAPRSGGYEGPGAPPGARTDSPRADSAPHEAPRNEAPAEPPRARPAAPPQPFQPPSPAARPAQPGAPTAPSPAARPQHAWERFLPPEARPGAGPQNSASPSSFGGTSHSVPMPPPPAAPVAVMARAPALGVAVAPAPLSPAPVPPVAHVPQAPGTERPKGPSRELMAAYRQVVERMRSAEPRWAAMYEHGVPSELTAARIEVAFPDGSFFGRQAQTPPGMAALDAAARFVLGPDVQVSVVFAQQLPGVSLAQQAAQEVDERKEGIKKRALTHPRVIEALKVFPELAQKQDVQVE